MENPETSIKSEDIRKVEERIARDSGVLGNAAFLGIAAVFVGFILLAKGVVDASGWSVFSGVLLCLIAMMAVVVQKNVDESARRVWNEFFSRYGFFTVAGEKVVFISSNSIGTHLHVRFEDGHEIRRYPVGCLVGWSGEAHWSCLKGREAGYTHGMAKIAWRTPEGKTGLVRKVEVYDHQDTEFLLKLDDGQIASFPVGKLVPINFVDRLRPI